MLRRKVNLKGNFTQEPYLAIPDVLSKKKHKHTFQFTQGTASLNWLNLGFKNPQTVFWHLQPCLCQHVLVSSKNSCKKIIKIPHLNHKCIPMTTSYLKQPSVTPSHVLTLLVKHMLWSSLCNKFKTHTHTETHVWQYQQRHHMAWKLL